MPGELIIFAVTLGAVIATGGIVGILASRRLTAWDQRRDEEPSDRED
jgi:hypothetical protein